MLIPGQFLVARFFPILVPGLHGDPTVIKAASVWIPLNSAITTISNTIDRKAEMYAYGNNDTHRV